MTGTGYAEPTGKHVTLFLSSGDYPTITTIGVPMTRDEAAKLARTIDAAVSFIDRHPMTAADLGLEAA